MAPEFQAMIIKVNLVVSFEHTGLASVLYVAWTLNLEIMSFNISFFQMGYK